MSKFAVGDRVRSIVEHSIIKGELATIVAIKDGSWGIYTELDNPVGHSSIENAKPRHGWYFSEDEIELVERKENTENENDSPSICEDMHASALGSLRANKDKPELTHIDPQFLLEFADLMTKSAKKYSRFNYALGQEVCTPMDSMSRHMLEFLSGKNNDNESGKSHLLHIAANAMIAWCTIEYHTEEHPELDNRINKLVKGYRNE